MTQHIERIGAMLANIGRQVGADFALDSRGAPSLTYAGATGDQRARALALNADLSRETGALALDDMGGRRAGAKLKIRRGF